jgi:hypothetical protein
MNEWMVDWCFARLGSMSGVEIEICELLSTTMPSALWRFERRTIVAAVLMS